jgi:mannose-1-phosphate guanylyltransferase
VRHAVILAGGSGTRLWPTSRRERPKQLLPIARDDEPMIKGAVAIAQGVVGESVLVVTAQAQAEATRAAVPDVDLVIEPVGRNTAAAIALGATAIAARDPDAVIAVLPADQHVRDRVGMMDALDVCLAAVERDDVIALVGIPPTRPETGFGYLEMAAGPSDGARPVLRFVEKPDLERARAYLASGRHLWNAGIFCLSARRALTELAWYLPETLRAARALVAPAPHGQIALGGDPDDAVAAYADLPSVSFDHGVMEKLCDGAAADGRVVAVAAAVGWNDVGSWAALPEVRGIDGEGNTIAGQAVVIDGRGNVVATDDGTLVALVGVSDLVVVRSGDAILVVPKDQAQRVREVVEVLSARGLGRYL